MLKGRAKKNCFSYYGDKLSLKYKEIVLVTKIYENDYF